MHNSCMAAKGKKKRDPIGQEMGRRLAACRKERGWSQAELAARTGWTLEDAEAGKPKGLSPSAIGNYEQGTRRIRNEEAEIFAQIFGLPSAYFLVVVDETEAEVIIAIRKRRLAEEPTRRRQPK